jgi:hypothetical protein
VSLTDGLTVAQVAQLLATPAAELSSARKKTLDDLLPSQRAQLSALALLHAYEATHGKGCAFSQTRKGPLNTEERDLTMLKLYRRLTGDRVTTDQKLGAWARVLYQRRITARTSGKLASDNPSPAMRRFFGQLMLKESEALGHTSGGERMEPELRTVEAKPGFKHPSPPVFLFKKNPEMQIRGIAVNDVFLLEGDAVLGGPPGLWFQAKVTGFVCRCGLPPILATFIATESGGTDRASLPPTLDVFCRKRQLKCQTCKKMKQHVEKKSTCVCASVVQKV